MTPTTSQMPLLRSDRYKNHLRPYYQRENVIVSSVKPAFVSTVGIQGNDAVERADIDHPISHGNLRIRVYIYFGASQDGAITHLQRIY